MITAYLVGISTYQENEDIEIRYSIYKDDELICKKNCWAGYKKAPLVTHTAIDILLKKLKQYKDEDIIIVINDGAVYEQLNGTSGIKKQDIRKVAKNLKKKIDSFAGRIVIKNVSTDPEAKKDWNNKID